MPLSRNFCRSDRGESIENLGGFGYFDESDIKGRTSAGNIDLTEKSVRARGDQLEIVS